MPHHLPGYQHAVAFILLLSFSVQSGSVRAGNTVTVADASLAASFYSDSSCLLTIDALTQPGKTIIDADVNNAGSRMLIHCDTDDGRRLTLLARGDSLNVSQRVPLLTRVEIEEGEVGMIAWLTRRGVHYADDAAPRRYVIAGSVLLRKSPPADTSGTTTLHNQRHAFGRVSGILEPILKSDSNSIVNTLPPPEELPMDGPAVQQLVNSPQTTPIEPQDDDAETDIVEADSVETDNAETDNAETPGSTTR